VKKGLFSTALGSVIPISTDVAFDKQYFLGIKVGNDTEMTPRYALQSAPYALALPGISVDGNGNVGIGSGNPSEKLTLNNGNIQLDLGCVVGRKPSDHFTYDNKNMAHYGLGWFADSAWATTGPSAWLSGFGGIKFFTEGTPKVIITPNGNLGIGSLTPIDKLTITGGNIGIDVNNGRIGIAPSTDIFTHLTRIVGNHSIGWYVDPTGNGNSSLWMSGFGGIRMFTASQLRIACSENGNVGIGTENPEHRLDVNGNEMVRGNLLVSSGLTCNGGISTTTLTLTSSRRFKDNVQPIQNPLATIMKLQGVTYTWKPGQGGKPDIGFIAEDVAQVLPELVTMEKDGVNAKGMDYSHMVALTVEGIKVQQQQIGVLKAENATLKVENAAIRARLARLEAIVLRGQTPVVPTQK
jgi:hypothetical protein